MYLKSEFRRRIVRLFDAIADLLEYDSKGCADHACDFMPALFSVFSYIWTFKIVNIFKS